MRITVVGIGYVGLSNAILLAQNHSVIALDINQQKVDMLNNKISPIADAEISEYLISKELHLVATTNKIEALKESQLIIIATPTDYDSSQNFFDTSTVEAVIQDTMQFKVNVPIVIKST